MYTINYDSLLDDLLSAIDYDIYKSYQEELAEEPEFVEDERKYLIDIIKSHINEAESKAD